LSQGEWRVSVDLNNRCWLIFVMPEQKIGPFPNIAAAEVALRELQAANTQRKAN